jgi:hypothetical protein
MSYCRWSSDGMKCDVYVYESEYGYVCHVAGRKIVNLHEAPECPSLLDVPLGEDGKIKKEVMKAFVEKHREWMEWLSESAIRENIGLEHDGKTFSCDTPGDMAETLIMLKEVGYQVPQYAIDALWEEQSEMDGL